ncbi:hypothetical protein KX729_25920 [Rhizobium sp. XQZ8]|uniref:hypothetical protein n=1 Tax=Rhizobium populisoli TaxID=2859785 RepID=UPI001CA4A030|nr:hypothetical protein [Rhizobium populisoli]MBW6424889.1 hypothetical protein [Rhizobium populisoli]
MSDKEYTAEELADRYGISRQQAVRHIARFGPKRDELDAFLTSSSRSQRHRQDELDRSSSDVSFGL